MVNGGRPSLLPGLSLRVNALKDGVPVVGVYEKAVTSKTCTEKL